MHYEVVIIGGAAAGLSAALTLGRSGRKTAVFDTGQPRNRPAHAAHNIFTRDGIPPSELTRIAREQLKPYKTVSLLNKRIVKAEKKAGQFTLVADDGETHSARRIILATGLSDLLPPIKGFQDLWGSKVLHCPYCHGWEVKDRPLAVIMNKEDDLHLAIMMHHWSQDLRVLTNGRKVLNRREKESLTDKGIAVIETSIAALSDERKTVKIELSDGTAISVTAIFARAEGFRFNNELAVQLGCRLSKEGAVIADEKQLSTVAGVFVAGDLADGSGHQVAIAAAGGIRAAIACNNGMIMEDFERS